MAELLKNAQTILVVDDEDDLLSLMQMSLRKAGYQVKTSSNGDDLLDIVTTQRPDLVLLDVHMQGIDGKTICHLLKHNKSTSKIIVLMFSANDNIEHITDDCGADGFIKKPYLPGKLNAELERIFARG